MDSKRKRRPQLLTVAIAAVFGVGAAVLIMWLAPTAISPHTGAANTASVQATVTTSTPCSLGDAHDKVTFQVDGRQAQADLDGCGARFGSTLQVVPPTAGESLAEPVQSDVGIPSGYRRIGFILLAIAGIGGGVLSAMSLAMMRPRHKIANTI